MNRRQWLIVLFFAFIGWILCFATIGIGRSLTSMQNTLIIHAIAAPIIFTCLSFIYFRKYNFTSPLATAGIFLGFIVLMDFFVVAIVINKSFEMFTSFLGTWLPFTSIFLSTYLTGVIYNKTRKNPGKQASI
jgi:hypothetical protein